VNLKTDLLNCGACGTGCAAGQVCSNGACAVSCQAGLTNCSGTCVNLQTDSAHCGSCAGACTSGLTCVGGGCLLVCSGGTTKCGDICANLQSDSGNCGACGVACGPGQTCTAGACKTTCTAGLSECSGACVNLQTDTANCGACGTACGAGQQCIAGACQLVCAGGTTDCSGSCVNLQNDPAHCGTCVTTCSGGQVCQSGACTLSCVGGTTNCSGSCVSLAIDPNNCGACGSACSSNHIPVPSCGSSVCNGTCASGWSDCNANKRIDGCEVNTASDNNNCGACGNVCPGVQTCVNGACTGCNNKILYLGDPDTALNNALAAAMNANGLVVTYVDNGTATYAGTPAANTFGAVYVSPGGGNSWNIDMPAAGQTAIVNAYNAGMTGVFFTEWSGYEVETGHYTTLNSIMLLTRTGGATVTQTFTLQIPGHPIWTGLPASFTTVNNMGCSPVSIKNGGVSLATVTECGGNGGMTIKDGAARIVQTVNAANYQEPPWTTNDPNTVKLFVNAMRWAAKCN